MKSVYSDLPLNWQQIIICHTSKWEQIECSFNHLPKLPEQLNFAFDPFTGLKCAGKESSLYDHWSQTRWKCTVICTKRTFTEKFNWTSSSHWRSVSFLFIILQKENCPESSGQKQWPIFSDPSLWTMFDAIMYLISYCINRSCCCNYHLKKPLHLLYCTA